MYMPVLPYKESVKSKQTSVFYGLENRDNAREGSLAYCKGLSPLKYPALAVLKGRSELTDYAAPSNLYGWDKLVAVDGNGLYYDGVFLCNVTPGEKQFAVVNTKLIVWPDKIMVDLVNQQVTQMNAQTGSLSGSEVTFTADSVTVALSPLLQTVSTGHKRIGNPYTENNNAPCVRLYTGAVFSDGAWSYTSAEEVTEEQLFYHKADLTTYLNGRVILPSVTEAGAYSFDSVFQVDQNRVWPAPNTDGVYGIITEVHTDDEPAISISSVIWCVAKLYRYGENNGKFTDFFSSGDVVSITGATNEANNVVRLKIESVADSKLTFAADTFTAGTQTAPISVQRAIPDLDYICAGENRLWGLSNTERAVYASGLGLPMNFYDTQGTSNDSYYLDFETKGDFTGICAYSGNILCWKEDMLHRIYGDYAAQYYMNTYNIRGVQAGAHKSLTIINEALYYLSRDGVMAYTGGTPELVSYALGDAQRSFVGAGSDGRLYHLCVREDGEYRHLVYDPVMSLWLCEETELAAAFALTEGSFYVLAGGKAYQCGQGGRAAWSAELSPMDEDVFGKKDYKWLYLRYADGSSTALTAEVRTDGGVWKTVYTGKLTGDGTLRIPLAPMRCDRLSLRLNGTGPLKLLSLRRDYRAGSEA